MNQRIARLVLAILCLAAIRAHALESDRQQAMSQACGLTAGRQQQYAMEQMPAAAPEDKAGVVRYRELLRYSSPSARDAARSLRAAEPALAGLDDQSFNDAIDLGIVLQSEPVSVAQVAQQILTRSANASGQPAALRQAWTGLCLQQLKAGITLARKRDLSLCNTFAVIGLNQRQRLESTSKEKPSLEQIETLLRNQPAARSMIEDTVALS